jgi:hypothetical protein
MSSFQRATIVTTQGANRMDRKLLTALEASWLETGHRALRACRPQGCQSPAEAHQALGSVISTIH